MAGSLAILDGNGNPQKLEVIDGSIAGNLVPVHAITGSISFPSTSTLTASLTAADLQALTSSISDVSSAIGLFNSQLYQALTGGPVSMSVDIVAGDVNIITSSIDKITTEAAKLTALSGSNGLKVYTLLTASVNLVNTGSLTASIYNFPATQSVSIVNTGSLTASVSVSNWPTIDSPAYIVHSGTIGASLDRGDTANNGLYVIPSGTISITSSYVNPVVVAVSNSYATSVFTGSYDFSNIKVSPVSISGDHKTLFIMNQTDATLYVALGPGVTPSNNNYNICVAPYSLYESQEQNVKLQHTFILDSSATKGKVVFTTTY